MTSFTPHAKANSRLRTVSDGEIDSLRDKIIEATAKFEEAISSGNKDTLRQAHLAARNETRTPGSIEQIRWLYKKHLEYFIDGADLEVANIKPTLIFVEPNSQWESIFKVVRNTWSLPYSKGYGRRLRFVVYDTHHDAVIGILGFQSPPADLSCRDEMFDFPDDRKLELINRTMDVYTIGAIPPYSTLLGGKLVAGLVCADDVRRAYWQRYAGRATEINNQRIEQPLVAATTTSIFGRSSIYNRLQYEGRLLAKPIGYTKGCGTIHLESIYPEIRKFLTAYNGEFTSGGYGNGPKIRWQNITRALNILGLPREYLEHGLRRQAFLFSFVQDIESGMAGGEFGRTINTSVEEYSSFWKTRWAIPRSKRIQGWQGFVADDYFSTMLED